MEKKGTFWKLLTCTVNCPYFEFHQFPFDVQLCSLLMTPSRKDEFSMNGSLVISKTFDIKKAHLQYMVNTLKISEGPSPDYEYALKNSAVGATFHLKRHIYPYIRYFCSFESSNFRTYRTVCTINVVPRPCGSSCPPSAVGGLGQRVVLWLGHLFTSQTA